MPKDLLQRDEKLEPTRKRVPAAPVAAKEPPPKASGEAAPHGYGGGDYGYGGGEEDAERLVIAGRSLHDYGIWFLRYSWLIAFITIVGAFAGYYVYSITPKTYESWARIEIERLGSASPEVYQGERVRLQASEELRAAVERFRLPRVYTALVGRIEKHGLQEIMPKRREWTLPWLANAKKSPSPAAPVSREDLSKLLKQWVRVDWNGKTSYVDVRVTHTDPKLAKEILDSLIAEYEALFAEADSPATEQDALDYILKKSSEIRAKIMQGEAAVARYRGCEELSTALREVRGEIAALEKRYLPEWPDLIEAKNRQDVLVERFSNELRKVIDSSPEEKTYWTEKESVWQGKTGTELLDAQLQLMGTRASLLNKELQTDERILDGLVTKSKTADVSKGYSTKPFSLVQPSTLPDEPIAPVLSRMLALFTWGALAFGMLLVFILGLIDQSIRTVSELEAITGIPVVGAIPVSEVRKKAAPIDLLMETKSDAAAIEALRTLRAGLAYLGGQEDHSSFVISSAIPSEGKSWIAANLAVAFAQQGDRTLLIDADLRRPVISGSFGLTRETQGLTDYLARSIPLDAIVHPTSTRNLWVVPAGGKAPNPPELLGSRGLKSFFEEIGTRFDRIIVDSAPLLPVSDTLLISRHVQTVLLAYRTGNTPRGALLRALKSLRSNRTEAAGLVANMLPRLKRASGYAHGYYYSYYGGSSANYYEEAES